MNSSGSCGNTHDPTKTTHKFGIHLPKTIKEALEIDKQTGTRFWRDAIATEMKDVDVAFEHLPSKSKAN